MFNLGRPDVLPVHDLGVRKGFQIGCRKRALPHPDPLERFGEQWRPIAPATPGTYGRPLILYDAGAIMNVFGFELG